MTFYFEFCAVPIVRELCQPGPCGEYADCYVSNNQEKCYCQYGYYGDPYTGCHLPPSSPCAPNPCGPNAQCFVGDAVSIFTITCLLLPKLTEIYIGCGNIMKPQTLTLAPPSGSSPNCRPCRSAVSWSCGRHLAP